MKRPHEKHQLFDRNESGVSCAAEESVSKEDWPFSISAPDPPFVWGRPMLLAHTQADAEKAFKALELYDHLMELFNA